MIKSGLVIVMYVLSITTTVKIVFMPKQQNLLYICKNNVCMYNYMSSANLQNKDMTANFLNTRRSSIKYVTDRLWKEGRGGGGHKDQADHFISMTT